MTSRLTFEGIVQTLRAAGCVFAEDEAAILTESAASEDDLVCMVEQRASGLPLEQVVGWAAFRGLRVGVEPGVFVPRRRTELLAEEALRLADETSVVVDLCCGASPVGVVLMTERPGAELHAADVDPRAVRCARRNLGAAGHVHQGDLDAALPHHLLGRVDVLVANAPYVPTGAIAFMPPEARDHEPATALDGGPDGLTLQRRVVEAAPRWLRPGGHLLVETSEGQAPDTAAAFVLHGLTPLVVRSEDLDATVVVGTLTRASSTAEP